jgi:hypothetical protein
MVLSCAGRIGKGQNIVLTYVGLETRNGESVQHLRSYAFQTISDSAVATFIQELSATDFYLDSASFLPMCITFNFHPDNNASDNLRVEVDFANYQTIDGIMVPMHIQRYQQGALMLDISVSGAAFNTGIPLTDFSIN